MVSYCIILEYRFREFRGCLEYVFPLSDMNRWGNPLRAVFPLSDMNRWGNPLRAANLFKHIMNVSVDMSRTMMSRCTALVTKHVNKQIQALLVRLGNQWTSKVHSSETESRIFLYSAYWQRRWGWCWKRISFVSATNYTSVNDCSDQTLSLQNPKSPPNFS